MNSVKSFLIKIAEFLMMLPFLFPFIAIYLLIAMIVLTLIGNFLGG